MMNKLLEVLDDNGMEVTIENIFSALDESNISAINEEISLVYKTDKALIDKLKRETRINLVN